MIKKNPGDPHQPDRHVNTEKPYNVSEIQPKIQDDVLLQKMTN